MSRVIHGTCRGCGRRLIIEPDKKISRHEAPLCEAYKAILRESKVKRLPDYHERTRGKRR